MICAMETVAKNARKAIVTDEHREEAGRLKAIWDARKAAGKVSSQATFGETYEIGNQSAVGQFLRGEVALSLKAARGFAKGLNCEIEDFSPRLAKEAAVNAEFAPAGDEFVKVKRADVQFAQGGGRIVHEPGEKSALTFRREYLRKLGVTEKSVLVVDGKGRSNEPDIPDGAVLLVTSSETAKERIRDGKYYAIRIGERLLVKKLYRQKDGKVLAVSGNPDWQDELIDGSEDFEIIGRALWMGAEL